MLNLIFILITIVYCIAAVGLMLYGFNCYIMTVLFLRKKTNAKSERNKILRDYGLDTYNGEFPYVTTQIPIFNEYNVAERVIRAACEMIYPENKHEIQVLDDSTDETSGLIDYVAAELKKLGHDINVIRRTKRMGFKAGALANGLDRAKGDLVVVFDADFVPPKDYLTKTVPFFLSDNCLGLVQARWGHLNRRSSLLTRVQSIGIDGHFMVEQSARCWNGLFMNFNGTAGVWRKQAISDAGGWQWDTLTEDIDLSYRVQLAGWKTAYLPDLVVPAEIPEDVSAFKSQQFRWAKGSIQTAIKLMPRVLDSKIPIFKKIEAFFHLTHYMVHPLMVTLAVLAFPVITSFQMNISESLFAFILLALILAMSAPSTLYLVGTRFAHHDWFKHIIFLPFLVIAGIGIAVSNSIAVFEAFIGKESAFIRTPKRGDRQLKKYKIFNPGTAFMEILLGLYCTMSFSSYLIEGKFLIGPFLAIYAAGFLFIGLLTIAHATGIYR